MELNIGHSPFTVITNSLPSDSELSMLLTEPLLTFDHPIDLDIFYPISDTTLKFKLTLSTQILREGQAVHEFKGYFICMFIPDKIPDGEIMKLIIQTIGGKIADFNKELRSMSSNSLLNAPFFTNTEHKLPNSDAFYDFVKRCYLKSRTS